MPLQNPCRSLFLLSLLVVSRIVFAQTALTLTGDFQGTHDPSIAKEGDTYYIFATGASRPDPAHPDRKPGQFAIRCSKDLKQWTYCGQVFAEAEVPQWIRTLSPGTTDLWAPDVSFFDGVYHLYYAFSLFGKNTSGIALATNVTLDPSSPRSHWVDRGLVLQSKQEDDFNAIDPNLVLDEKGKAWLSFGSFWSGIKMRKIDRRTGLLDPSDTRTYALATRAQPEVAVAAKPGLPSDSQAIEAPFILAHDGFYYLFVSWDLCCQGTRSTYRTMVGRSKSITGPYVDQSGKPMMEGGSTPLLQANDRWLGPGGESLLHTAKDDFIVFHAYDAATGHPALQVSTIAWKDGWPIAALLGGTSAVKLTGTGELPLYSIVERGQR